MEFEGFIRLIGKYFMSQSLVKNYVHIVFSTKYRISWIDENIEKNLHSYLAELCRVADSPPIIIGGYTDHIHILCLLSKKISLMKVVMTIKANSSRWAKTQGKKYEDFRWQNGYACFSVDYRGVDIVKRYIQNQHAHHAGQGFKNEYRQLMKENDLEYDERYCWD